MKRIAKSEPLVIGEEHQVLDSSILDWIQGFTPKTPSAKCAKAGEKVELSRPIRPFLHVEPIMSSSSRVLQGAFGSERSWSLPRSFHLLAF